MIRVPPALKIHGGGVYTAPRIVALLPTHLHYCEPYAGGLSVLFAKSYDGTSEVVNDINGDLTTFWNALASPETFSRLLRILEATPFSESVFDDAVERLKRPYVPYSLDAIAERAAAFFIVARQSLAGRQDSFAPLSRNRTRRRMNEQASAWLTAIEGLPLVHARLKRVVVLNRDALEVIRGQDGEKTAFYIDPPFMHETRATTGEYRYEMTVEQHRDLLVTLGGRRAAEATSIPPADWPKWWAKAEPIRGKFLLSGYRSPLYDAVAEACGWRRKDFDLPNNAAGGKEKRRMISSVWMNYTL